MIKLHNKDKFDISGFDDLSSMEPQSLKTASPESEVAGGALLKSIKDGWMPMLRNKVQTAIELEHATIPPYLTAMFSLAGTQNDEIADLIKSVVIEEMLHLTIACNLLNAIGGSPVLNKKDFVPSYPGPLPGGVGGDLIVPIAKFSKELVKDVFMRIEQPEDPIDIKVEATGETIKASDIANMPLLGAEANGTDREKQLKADIPRLLKVVDAFNQKDTLTIGEYYHQIRVLLILSELVAGLFGDTIFTGKAERQVVNNKWYPPNELFAITNIKCAVKGIDLIVDQGEGGTNDPFVKPEYEPAGAPLEPSHYYRFEEIVKGHKLEGKDGKYSYSGDPIPFNGQVPNMKENPKTSDYPVNSVVHVNSKLFNFYYTNLLNNLHETFNGAPEKLGDAFGLMYALRLYALKLLALPDPSNPGFVAGPSFEFVGADDLSKEEQEAVASVASSS